MMTDEKIQENAFTKGLAVADKMPGKIGTMIREDLRRGLGNITPQALCYRANGNLEHTDLSAKALKKPLPTTESKSRGGWHSNENRRHTEQARA